MMEQNPARPARKVAIADHLWSCFEDMAQQMGADRDGLINQAMFMFARLNGFMDAGNGAPVANGHRVSSGKAVPPVLSPVPAPRSVDRDEGFSNNRAASRAEEKVSGAGGRLDDDPVRREVAERVLETAAELERLIKGKGEPARNEEDGEESGDEANDGGLDGAAGPGLYLMAEGGELDRITKDRFLIGRGKHCDFVINSGKVSREHAAITREGSDFYIEDLGSSNGTWFNKQRIKRRKIEDGDEYFICSEKVKLVMR
jgi:hypothetical protein